MLQVTAELHPIPKLYTITVHCRYKDTRYMAVHNDKFASHPIGNKCSHCDKLTVSVDSAPAFSYPNLTSLQMIAYDDGCPCAGCCLWSTMI